MYEKSRNALTFQLLQTLAFYYIECIDSKMVRVKYDADCDGISLPRMSLDDDLIERNFHSRFWLSLKRQKFQGTISHHSWLRKSLCCIDLV